MFLVLMCGQSVAPMPTGLNGEEPAEGGATEGPRDHVQMAQRERSNKKGKSSKRVEVKKKDWIEAKKERRRAQGKKTAGDSKFTGRSRGPKF